MDLMPPLVQSSPTRTPKTYCRSESSTVTDCPPSPDLVGQHYSISPIYDLDLSSCSMASPYELSRLDQHVQQSDWDPRKWNPAVVLHPSLTSSRASLSRNSIRVQDDPYPSYDGTYWPAPAALSRATARADSPVGGDSSSSTSRLQRDHAATNHGYSHGVEGSQYPSPSISHAPYPPTTNNHHLQALSSQDMRQMAGPPAPGNSPCIFDDIATDWPKTTTDRYNMAESANPSQEKQHHSDAGSDRTAGLLPMAEHDAQQSSGSHARARQQKAPRKLTTMEDANFECSVEGCGKLFSRSYNFKAHMETHQEKRAYPFPCQVQDCTKKFVRKTDLRRHHQSVHMKERNYKCEFCGRGFSRRDTLGR